MPGQVCCIKTCPSRSHDSHGYKINNGVRFFRFPRWKPHEGRVGDVKRRRRMAWVAAVRRKDVTFDHILDSFRVCSLHFHSGSPSCLMLDNHPDWYPSLLLGHNSVKATNPERFERHANRKIGPHWRAEFSTGRDHWTNVNVDPPSPPLQDSEFLVNVEPELSDEECSPCQSGLNLIRRLKEENKELNEALEILRMNGRFLRGADGKVEHYTDITVSCF